MQRRRLAYGVVATVIVAGALLRPTSAHELAQGIGSALVAVDGFPSGRGAVEPVAYVDGVRLLSAMPVADGELDAEGQPAAAALWDAVVRVLPPEQLESVSQFALVTDGRDGTLGMVHRSERDDGRWILSIDPADAAAPGELERTLVHELAHMLTLGRGDVAFGPAFEKDCDGVATDVGCATPGSLIADWYTEFWSAGGASAGFASGYATTSSAEDLAETFLAWVVDDPERDGALEPKLAWLEGRPELVAVAGQVRENLSAGR